MYHKRCGTQPLCSVVSKYYTSMVELMVYIFDISSSILFYHNIVDSNVRLAMPKLRLSFSISDYA
jgi:hypothetical protein